MATRRGNRPEFEVAAVLDRSDLNEGLRQVNDSIRTSAVDINAGLEIIQKAWGAVEGAVSAAAGAVVLYTERAAEQERVEKRALSTIRLYTSFTDAQFAALQRANGERQRLLGIGDEEQLQLQGTLAAMRVRNDLLGEATEATIALSNVTGQGLNEASRAVAKAFTGQVSALQEYGIKVGSVSEAQVRLRDLWRVALEQSDTFTTRVNVLNAAWGDFTEQLGSAINESEAGKESIDALTDAVTDFTDLLNSDAGVDLIDAMARAIAGVASDAINAALGVRQLVRDIEQLDQEETGGRVGALFNLTSPSFLLSNIQNPGALKAELDALVNGRAPANDDGSQAAIDPLQALADRLAGIATSDRESRRPRAGGRSSGGRRRGGRRGPANDDPVTVLGGGGDFDAGALDLFGSSDLKFLSELFGLEQAADAEQRGEEAAARIRASFGPMKLALEQEMQDLEERDALFQSLGEQSLSILSQNFMGFVETITSGSGSALQALGGFVGGVISQLGQMLLQLGTAAVLAQALSAIPIFAGLVGPPGVSAAAGAALIAAGAGMMAVGGAIGGASAGGSSASGSGRSGSASFNPSARFGDRLQGRRGSVAGSPFDNDSAGGVPSGFVRAANDGPIINNYVINMSGQVYGSEAALGRATERAIRRSRRLEGAAVGS